MQISISTSPARLSRSNQRRNGRPANGKHFRLEFEMSVKSRLIYIPVGRDDIQGDLRIPEASTSIVVFAHGSGSSRHSPRNMYVADTLNAAGFSTLLIDLLTPDEEVVDLQTSHLRFNIGLLAERLSIVTNWLDKQSVTA